MVRVPLGVAGRLGERGPAAHLRAHDARRRLLLGRDLDVALRWPRDLACPDDAAARPELARHGLAERRHVHDLRRRRLRVRATAGKATRAARWATERRTAARVPHRVASDLEFVQVSAGIVQTCGVVDQRRRLLLGRRHLRPARRLAVGARRALRRPEPAVRDRPDAGLRRAAVHRDQHRVRQPRRAA